MTHPFRFEFEVEAFQKAGVEPGKERRIGGIVSTDGVDRQGEVLLQEGLDFEPFVKAGWFNDNHDSSTEALIGYPDKAEMRKLPDGRTGWYVEGYLLKGTPRADAIWDLANALQKSERKLGFSVEGSVVERDPVDPKKVRKAIVREVAITRCPVNTETSLSVLAKSLSAGHGAPGVGVAGDGAPLRVESLEADGKGDGTEDEDEKKKKKSGMSKSEAVAYLLTLDPRLSIQAAERIVNITLRRQAA